MSDVHLILPSKLALPRWVTGLLIIGVLILLIAIFVFFAYYLVWGWTGFVSVPTSTAMSSPKYLWDWMSLLNVPSAFVGAIITALAAWNTSQNENKVTTLKSNIEQSLLSTEQTNPDLGKNMARAWVITTMPKLPRKLRAEVISYIVRAGLAIDDQKKPLETMQALRTAGVKFHPTAFVASPSLSTGDTANYAFIDRESLAKLYLD